MQRLWRRLVRDNSGSVAPTVALSLIALIASGGIAFDYARLAAMDSELQSAADQAALAAAAQLDGKTGAITRATTAAQSMVANKTWFSNDTNAAGSAVGVTAANVTFYIKDTSKPDSIGAATTDDTKARFVSVTVDSRKAYYALTPVVGALSSGDISANAVAGLGSSICKVPPLMMCNPAETGTSTAFNIADWTGKGIRLVANGPGGAWGPGVFGYLQSNLGNGASALEEALGANNPPGDCQDSDSVTVKPGVQTSVTDAINTRFDIYESGLVGYCTGTSCSPALNTRKDVVHPDFSTTPGGKAPNCGLTGKDGWEEPSQQYLPVSKSDSGPTPTNMGFPRDICHAVSDSGNCTAGRVGDGEWDRALYFEVNYPGAGAANLSAAATWAGKSSTATSGSNALRRYDVYLWEVAAGKLGRTGTGPYAYSSPQCGVGAAPGPSQADRRKITVAMVNCIKDASGLNGSATVRPEKWIEVFLVEPSIGRASKRTSASDVYVEMIGEATPVSNGVNMTVRRDVPYLVR
ncbi:TadE/TadG family type IV pilus assembly protein [Sphingomonas sp. GCM10030256]|uniref:TadE/TadG family type IV pilus assembly protein n=1 Tax=Sphingomonas sp. GCM10030256 TaxID=3273427 RepID=UPI003614F1E1